MFRVADAVCVAHGTSPDFVGLTLSEVLARTRNSAIAGEDLHAKFVQAAYSSDGGGWVEYSWRRSADAPLKSKGAYVRAAVDKGGVLNLYSSIPVLGANVSHDLLSEAGLSAVPEKSYVRKDGETQLVPVGPKTGVGAFNGWQMPGFAVSMIKGKDYMLKNMGDITEGKKWAKA